MATAALVTREPGVIAGVDVALLVLDEVLGPEGSASSTGSPTAPGCPPVRRCCGWRRSRWVCSPPNAPC